MDKYINHEALPQKKKRGFFSKDDFNAGWNACLNNIESIPVTDVVPVRHGRWIDEGQYGDNFPHHAWRCSECGEHVIEIDIPWYKYCPNCGALMDKDGDGE